MTIHFQAKHPTGFIIDSPLQPVVFPDGAVHIKGADDPTKFQYHIADVRGLSHDELFTLAMWAEAVGRRGEKMVLILPYLPGARMDRGNPTGAAVYGKFILDNIMPDQIITIDPHSQAALKFFTDREGPMNVTTTTVFPVERILRKEVQDPTRDNRADTYVGVIAPDKGAVDRATRAAQAIGVPVYHADKVRDFGTGKLSGFQMIDELPDEGKLLIFDDICDGGGTFIGLAEATGLPKERLDLWVTHGIFSKGLVTLLNHFDMIHTTDSYFGDASFRPMIAEAVTTAKFAGKFSDHFRVHKLTPYLYPEIKVEQ